MSFGQSVLDVQTRNVGELIYIRRHNGEAQHESLRCDQEIIRSNGSLACHLLPDVSIVSVVGLL